MVEEANGMEKLAKLAERVVRDHAQEVWVARFGRKRGAGGEQDRVDTSHGSQP